MDLGQNIRYEMFELQQAQLGRKCSNLPKDRRPLDPPPVVALKLWEIDSYYPTEREISPDEMETSGFICMVDLFPILPSSTAEDPQPGTPPPLTTDGMLPSELWPPTLVTGSSSLAPCQSADVSRIPADIVCHLPSPEPAIADCFKVTGDLVGSTFVSPIAIEWGGEKFLAFVFSDLTVKSTGSFFLRYRFFDVRFPVPDTNERNVQAECYGGAFEVFPTKGFPGLGVCTELTKHLRDEYGLKVPARGERKTRARGKRKQQNATTFSSEE